MARRSRRSRPRARRPFRRPGRRQRIASRIPRLGEGKGPVLIQLLAGGAPQMVPGSESALNITPMFSPDGQFLAYAQSGEQGTNIQVANVPGHVLPAAVDHGSLRGQPFTDVCARRTAHRVRLDPGRSAADLRDGCGRHRRGVARAVRLSAPRGARTPRSGRPTGCPWRFTAKCPGGPQIFVLDVAGRRLKQLTSAGRNEDPTWAPDGRHIAFVSDRTGRRQIWVIDTETGRVRAINHWRGSPAPRLVAPPRHDRSPTPRRVIMTRSSLIAVGAFAFAAACGGKKPPEQPAPEPTPADGSGARAGSAPAPAPAPRLMTLPPPRARRPSAPVQLTADLTAMIHFDYDKSDIKPEDQANLDRKAAILAANPGRAHPDRRQLRQARLRRVQPRAGQPPRGLRRSGTWSARA